MRLDDFSFETDSISVFSIEESICDHCGLSYCDSSSIEPAPNLNKSSNVIIFKSNEGRVSCVISINQGAKKKYLVNVRAVEFVKARSHG